MNAFEMRQPCIRCGATEGKLTESGPHIKVSCAACGAYAYFAPKRDVARFLEHPTV